MITVTKCVYVLMRGPKPIAYAACISVGKFPLWATWTAGWKFLRFYGARADWRADYADCSVHRSAVVCKSSSNPEIFDTAQALDIVRVAAQTSGVERARLN